MSRLRDEAGFGLVETMVAIMIFSVTSVAFYQVLFGQVRGTTATETAVRIGEEARAGFNRMVRDVREGDMLSAASPTSFTVKVNFDGNGLYESPNAQNVEEVLTYAYDASARTITLNGEVLMAGVEKVDETTDVFSYGSNVLDYDWDNSGATTWIEVNNASCAANGITGVGDCDAPPVLDAAEFPHLATVSIALKVDVDGYEEEFRSTVQLRNRV
jgi:prepilin-type N-terminal cleavage/methylation domain-containing protein